jgi:hypothetical protein
MGEKPEIVYRRAPGATPEAERAALAAVYTFVLERHKRVLPSVPTVRRSLFSRDSLKRRAMFEASQQECRRCIYPIELEVRAAGYRRPQHREEKLAEPTEIMTYMHSTSGLSSTARRSCGISLGCRGRS